MKGVKNYTKRSTLCSILIEILQMMCRRCSRGCVVQEQEERRQIPLIASCDKVDNLCGRCSGDVTCLDLVIGYI